MERVTPSDITALKREIFSSLHCAMPGIVESFDPETQTASVRPAVRNGSFSLPVIQDVPVFFPGTRASGITWPVSAGDECLLIFADFDIDRWFESGEAGEPASARRHALPDAFAFVGFRSRGNALEDFSRGPDRFACRQLSLQSANGLLTGTGTAGQAGSSSVTYIPSRWTFNLPFTPVPGDTITIQIPVAGVNAGVWLSVDSGGTYLPVATNSTSRLTTHFAAGHIISLVYEEGLSTSVYPLEGGSATQTWTGGRWCVLNYYDSNTTYSNASLGQGYGTCATAEATAAKTVSLSSYALTTGGYVAVKFTYAVPASATLNVNGKGAKPIYYRGAAIPVGIILAGDVATFVYNGSQYILVSIDRQTHDDRYYTETEVDALLSGKSDTGHKHSGADITSGTLALNRGGTGQTATGATTAIADIATAAADCEITLANYAYWGKVAMVRLTVKKTTAVSSGTTTLCTLASGKRPKYAASAQWAWHNGAIINTNGTVQVNGAISAGASISVYSTYILA